LNQVFENSNLDINPTSLVLLPALNEEDGIGLTINELKGCFNKQDQPHFLVIDGNSKDKTAEVAKSLGAEVVTQTGKGKGDAFYCAIQHLNHSPLEYVILIDADHTYPPKYIPEMIKILEGNPQVGMVCGNRFNSTLPCSSGGYTFYVGNKILAFLHSLMNGVNLHDPLTGLRVIRWAALKDWKPTSKGFDIEVELNHYIERKKLAIKEIDIEYRERLGAKKLKARHGLTILRRIFGEALNSSKLALIFFKEKA
jgi:dolichol-phosphate mannosyltransferase